MLFILSDPPSRGLPVSISDMDKDRLKIAGAPVLPLGCAVKVLESDRLWLGEIIECHPDGVAIIQVSHSLKNLTELTRLADRFTGRVALQPHPEPTLS